MLTWPSVGMSLTPLLQPFAQDALVRPVKFNVLTFCVVYSFSLSTGAVWFTSTTHTHVLAATAPETTTNKSQKKFGELFLLVNQTGRWWGYRSMSFHSSKTKYLSSWWSWVFAFNLQMLNSDWFYVLWTIQGTGLDFYMVCTLNVCAERNQLNQQLKRHLAVLL